MIAFWQFFYNKKELTQPNTKYLNYNQVLDLKIEATSSDGYYQSSNKDTIIEWQGKISAYYSQITGIKFCVIDNNHQEIDINKPCNWFWTGSEETKDADSTLVNPGWDGLWVNYILTYYKVPFDKKSNFYNDVYKIKGKIKGIDCGADNKCVPDIEIINITK
jgi:hypothetical protein